jgi:hypothetical protein
MRGRGVGFAPQRPSGQPWQPGRRSGPTFEQPRTFFPASASIPAHPYSTCALFSCTCTSSPRYVSDRSPRVHGQDDNVAACKRYPLPTVLTPVPDSDVPSLQTFRKPTQRPPPRPARTGTQMQYTRRSASMV